METTEETIALLIAQSPRTGANIEIGADCYYKDKKVERCDEHYCKHILYR